MLVLCRSSWRSLRQTCFVCLVVGSPVSEIVLTVIENLASLTAFSVDGACVAGHYWSIIEQ